MGKKFLVESVFENKNMSKNQPNSLINLLYEKTKKIKITQRTAKVVMLLPPLFRKPGGKTVNKV